eukprot:4448992-Ditylum_brightwellii.AAC.1
MYLHDDSKKQKEIDHSSFAAGRVENFWECKHCNIIPYPWRAKGSVVFSSSKPSIGLIEKHLKNCMGRTPLQIPQNAVITPFFRERSTLIKIKWDKYQGARKSARINERGDSTKANQSHVFEGVEDEPL